MSGFFLTLYFLVWAPLMLYGLHRYYLVRLYYRNKSRVPVPQGAFRQLPRVTVQLPIYNEMYVVERLIQSVCRINYPQDLLEIQILDDSTDVTRILAQTKATEFKQRGYNVKYIHRKERRGFKAGALEAGMRKAEGDYLAVFDADFVPHPDILQRAMPYFTDPRVGMVQVRWEHINKDYSLLTKIQSILLDGHFVIEHSARSRSGRFFNFNGTAGIWRKDCIVSSGGWHHDTLTEDLDLSYRAQIKGWNFIYLQDFTAPAELPVEMNAFKIQQHRWAKGGIQTAKKLLPVILRSTLPLKVKIEAVAHLTGNMAFLLLLVLSLLMYPLMASGVDLRIGRFEMQAIYTSLLLFGTGAVSMFYLSSQKELNRNWISCIPYLPLLMSLGIGLSVNNSRAVLEALLGYDTPFRRTPKYRLENKRDTWQDKKYLESKNLTSFLELLFAFYFFYTIFFALKNRIFVSVPFLLIFLVGFLYVPIMSFFQSRLIIRQKV